MVRNGIFLHIIFSKKKIINRNHIWPTLFVKKWFLFQVEISKNYVLQKFDMHIKMSLPLWNFKDGGS